jgi:hypothetical protein
MNQRREIVSEYIENEYNLAYEITDPRDSNINNKVSNSEYYYYDEVDAGNVGGEYVLPPQDRNIIQSETTQVVPKVVTKKNTPQDLYDEDHYAIANVGGSVTKELGTMKQAHDEERPKSASARAERIYITKKMKIIGLIILLLVLGIIGGIIIAIVTGGNSSTDLEKKCIDDVLCGTLTKEKECHDHLIQNKCQNLCGTCS